MSSITISASLTMLNNDKTAPQKQSFHEAQAKNVNNVKSLLEKNTFVAQAQKDEEDAQQKQGATKKTLSVAEQREYDEQLLKAAYDGNIKEVERLLQAGANLEAVDAYGNTPLYSAVQKGHKGIVELLINQHANREAQDNDGRKPLHLAALSGDTDTIAVLIGKRANLEAVDKEGWTPLHWAVSDEQSEAVALLIEKGINLEAVNEDSLTPLQMAEKAGYKAIIEILISKKSKENEVNVIAAQVQKDKTENQQKTTVTKEALPVTEQHEYDKQLPKGPKSYTNKEVQPSPKSSASLETRDKNGSTGLHQVATSTGGYIKK